MGVWQTDWGLYSSQFREQLGTSDSQKVQESKQDDVFVVSNQDSGAETFVDCACQFLMFPT